MIGPHPTVLEVILGPNTGDRSYRFATPPVQTITIRDSGANDPFGEHEAPDPTPNRHERRAAAKRARGKR